MLPQKSSSPADSALARFREIVAEQKLVSADETLTESDTRSKLIDPLF
jgi:hypothetical protein